MSTSLRLAGVASAAMMISLAQPATAQMTATFLDGKYTMSAEACAKLKALEAGGPRNVNTVPWYVERIGIGHWEGSCAFRRITELKKGLSWRIDAACQEGPNKSREVYTWVRKGDGQFDVTLKGQKKPVRYKRCELRQK